MTRFIAGKTPQTPEELQIIEKRKRKRYFRIVKVRENDKQLALITCPKGICFTKLNPFESKRGFEDGSIVVVYGNEATPNSFEQRDLNDIDEFISNYLTVIEDNPKGVTWSGARKLETSRETEYTKQFGFNEHIIELLDEQLRAINKEKEETNLKLKSKPHDKDELEIKLEEPVMRIVEI
ncbi:MAG: hypothetical protein R2685_10945 [Candidatus Nitrosocosmicus sp.]|nr:hypothetical protein [Candidatus Nitrosocosmicus sp.]